MTSRYHTSLVLLALCLGVFMTVLDTSIVNIAVPSLIAALPATLDQVLWVLNLYTLVYVALLITAGRLGDRFGPRRVLLVGLTLFTLASVACGLSATPFQLVQARGIQGIGAALLAPQALPILTSIIPPERRGAAFGATSAVANLGALTGPTVGGFIVSYWGWPGVFFINLPVGLLAVALVLLVIPDQRPSTSHRLDLVGVGLVTAALVCVTFGLIEGEPLHWGTVWWVVTVPGILAAGLVFLGMFVFSQVHNRLEPLLPVDLFADHNFLLMCLVASAVLFGILGQALPITIYFQEVLGLSPFAAGLTMTPSTIVSALAAPVAGRLSDRLGGKFVLLAALVLFAIGLAYIDLVARAGGGRWDLLPGQVIFGLGLGCTFAPLFSVALQAVTPRLAGAASGVLNTMQEFGALLGAVTVGALLQSRLGMDFAPTDAFPGLYVEAMRLTLLLPIGVVVVAAVGCLAIRPPQHSSTG